MKTPRAGNCSASAEFFSSAESATKMREQIADECMHEDPPRAVGAGRKRHKRLSAGPGAGV